MVNYKDIGYGLTILPGQLVQRKADNTAFEAITPTKAFIVVSQNGDGDFNGSTSTEIQNAIDFLTNGGTIYIKSGIYTINSKILISSNCNICGDGENTILIAKNGLNDDIIVNKDGGSGNINISITNIKIDGNYENNISGGAIFLRGTPNIIDNFYKIKNVTINGVRGKGISFVQVGRPLVEGCYVINTGSNQIDAFVCRDVQFLNNFCDGTYQYVGILVNRAVGRSIISGNIVKNMGDDGIQVRGYETAEKEYTNTTIVTNNIVYNCGLVSGGQGIFINGKRNRLVTVSNNIITHTTKNGIEIGTLFEGEFLISSNQIFLNGKEGDDEGFGINTNGLGSGIISNNIIAYNYRGGINGGDNSIITGNSCYNNGTSGLSANGIYFISNCSISSNNCYNLSGVEQLLIGNSSSGTNIITIIDVSPFLKGQLITITDGINSENVFIGSIDSTTQITVTSNLINSYLVGDNTKISLTPSQGYGLTSSGENNVIVGNNCFLNIINDYNIIGIQKLIFNGNSENISLGDISTGKITPSGDIDGRGVDILGKFVIQNNSGRAGSIYRSVNDIMILECEKISLNDVLLIKVKNTAGTDYTTAFGIKGGDTPKIIIGKINLTSLPTSSTGLITGDVWNDGGTLKIIT